MKLPFAKSDLFSIGPGLMYNCWVEAVIFNFSDISSLWKLSGASSSRDFTFYVYILGESKFT